MLNIKNTGLKYILTAILLLFAGGFQSCDKSLEETIYGKISESNYWKTEKDAVTGVKAAYTVIRGGWHGLSFWQFAIEDGGTDISTGGYFAMNDYVAYTGWSATTPDFNSWGLWTPFWSGINYANTVLDYVPGMDISQEVKDRVTGEGYALRAMIYFHLVNWFGGMPEVTTTREAPLSIPRQTVEHNYALMESDLLKAIPLLPLKSELVSMGEADYGRLSKGAAQALLAKVYLQQGKWQECADICTGIVNSGEYMLEPDYMDIFTLENEGFKNKEEIWVLPFVTGTSPEIEANVLQVYLFKAPEKTAYSKYYDWNGDIRVTSSFYNSFESGDKRKEGLYYSASGGVSDPVMLVKYPPDPATAGAHSGTDYPFIRYADVLLMRAESLARLGDIAGSVSDVNTVRSRAGLSGLDPSAFDQTTLLGQVYRERRWEFYFEGHAKQDMIRMNYQGMLDYIKTVSTDWQQYGAERYLLIPIPANAVAANPGMTQNPGFE